MMSSCLSFKGVNIPLEMKTYYVVHTEIQALNAPPEIAQLFSEALRKTIREQSKLVSNDEEPDVMFTPSIRRYSVNAVSPEAGNSTAFNRLTVDVSINYENFLDESKNFTKSFSAFEDFESSTSLQSVEFDLVEDIFIDITERVFNDTYSDW